MVKMENIFHVTDLTKESPMEQLIAEAHSQVKSRKVFQVYEKDGRKMIFKPLSKSKPLTTPFFAYSEVFWSYIIHTYFDSSAPRYYLATDQKVLLDDSSWYSCGVLVESLTPRDEELINLFDYQMAHPDKQLGVTDYINYCMEQYDYTKILESDFIKDHREYGSQIAYQILLSILREDQNFHYENINFLKKGDNLSIAPPIDFEFSTPFLYPENEILSDYYHYCYCKQLGFPTERSSKEETERGNMSEVVEFLYHRFSFKPPSLQTRNICMIVREYPEVVEKFLENLDRMNQSLLDIRLSDADGFIQPFSSNAWAETKPIQIVDLRKEELRDEDIDSGDDSFSPRYIVDLPSTFAKIEEKVATFSKQYQTLLQGYLEKYCDGIQDLESISPEEFFTKAKVFEKTLNKKQF